MNTKEVRCEFGICCWFSSSHQRFKKIEVFFSMRLGQCLNHSDWLLWPDTLDAWIGILKSSQAFHEFLKPNFFFKKNSRPITYSWLICWSSQFGYEIFLSFLFFFHKFRVNSRSSDAWMDVLELLHFKVSSDVFRPSHVLLLAD